MARTLLLLPTAVAAASNASPPVLRGLAAKETCHTAAEGEWCHTAVTWAKQHGIKLHPEWYPALSQRSSFEAFQDHIHRLDEKACPLPCPVPWEPSCHTAVEGEQCHTAVVWAMQHGIVNHPEWYANLTEKSSFEAFQNHLYALNFDNCPLPCDFAKCHTAVGAERCAIATQWAMQHGIYEHPEWYPALTPQSSYEAFQAHLHALKYDNCSYPCAPETTTTAAPSTTPSTTVKPREDCKLAVDVFMVTATGNLKHLPGYMVAEGLCHQAEPAGNVYLTSGMVPVSSSCADATLGLVRWYNNSKCAGAPLASTTFAFGNVTASGCRDVLGEVVEGAQCLGRTISA